MLTLKKAAAQRQQDETITEAITESIEAGEYQQTEITAHCKDEYNIGWRTVERVLNEYSLPPSRLASCTHTFGQKQTMPIFM